MKNNLGKELVESLFEALTADKTMFFLFGLLAMTALHKQDRAAAAVDFLFAAFFAAAYLVKRLPGVKIVARRATRKENP